MYGFSATFFRFPGFSSFYRRFASTFLQYIAAICVFIEIILYGTVTISQNIVNIILSPMRCFVPLLLVIFSGHLPMVADGQDYFDDPVPEVEYPVWNDEKYEVANSA